MKNHQNSPETSGSYKIKGSVLLEVVKGLRTFKEAGRAATPPALHSLLDSRILPSSRYEETVYHELLHALTKVLTEQGVKPRSRSNRWQNPPDLDVWDGLGRTGAEGYYDGVYRRLFREGDPMATLKNYPALWNVRHEVGRINVVELSATSARVELMEYPFVSADYCKMVRGMIWGLLHLSGGKDIEVEKGKCVDAGDDICTWDARWGIAL